MKKIILALIVVSSFLQGCKEDESTKPDNPEIKAITVNIDHTFGETAIDFDSEFTLPSMEKVTFSRYAYIIGNVYLVKSDDTKVPYEDTYALIDIKKGNTNFTIPNVEKGEYKAIGFSVGLDSATNHGNPNVYHSEHPLAPINNSLHWSWAGGYIFTAIEGKTIADDESFVFHLAGAMNRLDFEFPMAFTKNNPMLKANLTYDINEVFQNPNTYNIAFDGSSAHTVTSSVTTKLIGNMKNVFTLQSISE